MLKGFGSVGAWLMIMSISFSSFFFRHPDALDLHSYDLARELVGPGWTRAAGSAERAWFRRVLVCNVACAMQCTQVDALWSSDDSRGMSDGRAS